MLKHEFNRVPRDVYSAAFGRLCVETGGGGGGGGGSAGGQPPSGGCVLKPSISGKDLSKITSRLRAAVC